MRLVIQIPCLDEEQALPDTLKALPRHVEGFDVVEWLVIDDGSTDRTVEVAREGGVDHVVRLPTHKGLAVAFQAGIDASLKLGADVIVNTDADGQYDPADIPRLVAPILHGEADLVVGDRGVGQVEDFSWAKRRLQKLGSSVVSRAAGMPVPDATSGFRAYNRDAALGVVVLSRFTYTLETLIQAGASTVTVGHVPIQKNRVDRPSRLFRSNWDYIRRSIGGILRVATFYSPLRTFTFVASLLGVAALVSWYPFLSSWIQGEGTGRIQSIILGAIFAIAAVQVMAVGVLADILGKQRGLTQETLERLRRLELHLGVPPSHYERGSVEGDLDGDAHSRNDDTP